MWNLGREREKDHARKFLGALTDSSLIETVIDRVHDLMEGGTDFDGAGIAFRRSFIEGGSGVWASTGSWLVKASREFPDLLFLWGEFVTHSSAKVRFRAASFVGDLPEEEARRLLPKLLADQSATVRSKIASEQYSTQWEWVYPLLAERLAIEGNPIVIESLNFAIETIQGN